MDFIFFPESKKGELTNILPRDGMESIIDQKGGRLWLSAFLSMLCKVFFLLKEKTSTKQKSNSCL